MNTQSIERFRKQLKKAKYGERRDRLHYEKAHLRGPSHLTRHYYISIDLNGKTNANDKSAYWTVTVSIRCVATTVTKDFVTGRESLLEEIEDWIKFMIACLEFNRL